MSNIQVFPVLIVCIYLSSCVLGECTEEQNKLENMAITELKYGVGLLTIWSEKKGGVEVGPAMIPKTIKTLLESFRKIKVKDQKKVSTCYMVYAEGGVTNEGDLGGIFLGIEVVMDSGNRIRKMYDFKEDEDVFFRKAMTELMLTSVVREK